MPRLSSLLQVGGKAGKTILPWNEARIITHGYLAGGYKSSSPWRSVERTRHDNDTTTNLGDLMTEAAAYTDGANSDNYFYVYSVVNAFSGESTTTWSMNTNTASSRGSSTAAWNMSVSRGDLGTMVDYEHAGAKIYIVGGGNSRTDRFDMKTEVMSTGGFPPNNSGGNYTASLEGEVYGWHKTDGTGQRFAWANETFASWGTSPGSDGWGKSLSSYKGHGYMKNGGNLNNTLVKINDGTGAQISSFTVQDAGEENYQSGANKGYCVGHFNGAQNNNTYKVSYTSDTYATLASTPTAHAGCSSAALASCYNFNNTTFGNTAPSY